MKKKLLAVFGSVIVLALVLAACQPAEPAEQPTPETIIETVVVTEEVVVTEVVTEVVEVEVTPATERFGGWLDTIVVVADPTVESAVARLLADDIDIYAQTATNPEAFQTVQDEGLKYVRTLGSYNEITVNPAGPELNDGTLNPFASAAVRKALNLIIDRDYIVQEIMGGLAVPRYTFMNSLFPDGAKYAATLRQMAAELAYDPEAADEIITAELEPLGAEKVDGVWSYNGEPITLIFLIRTEDERLEIGDYVANQVESLGFTVDRQYKTSSEASPLWVYGDPNDGLWHLYTGGWISSAISRDDGWVPQFMFSPRSGYGFSPLWQNYEISDEADAVFQALDTNNFNTLEERDELFAQAIPMTVDTGFRIFLVTRQSFLPMDNDVEVAYDLAAAVAGANLAGRTLRFADEVGGTMTFAMADVLTDPWNPIAGSNWVYDSFPISSVQSFGVVADPFTGLYWPERIETATITVEEGLPVGQTLDWLTLEFAPEIQVPGDAWVEWDATDQVFITADEQLAEMAAMPEMDTDPGTIVDVAVADGRFTTLATALTEAELVETLSGEGPFTVFAPTDDAFAALPEGTLDELLADIPALTDVLTYHVVSGYAPAEKVLELDALTTVLGKNVDFTVDEEGNVFVNDAQVLVTDVMANNGVIHVIDTVLIPPEGEEEDPVVTLVPEYYTARTKSTVVYPDDLFETVKWHDGSPISLGDFVMGMIMTFDQAKEESAIYDESMVGDFESFMSAFKGFKIASTDPLTIEYYSDVWYLDAEWSVTTLWPDYGFGEMGWPIATIGNMADADEELAWSADKADALEVDVIDYSRGPQLEILRAKLDTAIEEDLIPYAPTLGQYITAEEAAERYQNVLDWFRVQGHFWIGTGPYYLNKVFPVEKTLTLTRFEDYPDLASRWSIFGEPQLVDIEVDGPGRVTVGEEVTFDAFVTFAGEPYPSADIKEVIYLLFDATGALADSGSLEMVEEGLYSLTLSGDVTGALESGSNRLEVIATSALVAIPGQASYEFVTE